METKVLITFRWWRMDGQPVVEAHQEALEESAWERITEMTGEGYTEGDLIDTIRTSDDDPEGGVSYTGWWEMKKQETEGEIGPEFLEKAVPTGPGESLLDATNPASKLVADMAACMKAAIEAGDWKVDGACDPDSILRRAEELLKG